MQAINLEASIEKKKMQVPVLGRVGRGNKGVSWSGSGKATFHYNSSIFRELLYRFKESGETAIWKESFCTSSVQMTTIWRKKCFLPLKILKFRRNLMIWPVCKRQRAEPVKRGDG